MPGQRTVTGSADGGDHVGNRHGLHADRHRDRLDGIAAAAFDLLTRRLVAESFHQELVAAGRHLFALVAAVVDLDE